MIRRDKTHWRYDGNRRPVGDAIYDLDFNRQKLVSRFDNSFWGLM